MYLSVFVEGVVDLKRVFVSIVAILCALNMVSCSFNIIQPVTTPPPVTSVGSGAPTDSKTPMPTGFPSAEPSEAPTMTLTPSVTLTPTPTPTPSITPDPTIPINKFDSYVEEDFEINVDNSSSEYDLYEYSKGQMILGNLMVINDKHGYNSKYTKDLSTIMEEKHGAIGVSRWSLQCTSEALKAIDAFSTAYDIAFPDAERTLLIHEAFKKSTEGSANAYNNEYLSGLMFKLLFWDGSFTYKIDNNSMKSEKRWLLDNCSKYGLIVRYTSAKENITGVKGNNSEFRYVGVPHSYYINENEICLEEYIEIVKNSSFESRLSYTDPTGDLWEIYYVPASSDSTTAIKVDKGSEFSISGDNIGGYIVTVKKSNQISIDYSRLDGAVQALKNKEFWGFNASVTQIFSEGSQVNSSSVIMSDNSFRISTESGETIVYKDGVLYYTDTSGNTQSTEYTYENAIKKYLSLLGNGKNLVIAPTESSLDLGSVNFTNDEYEYIIYLRDTDLIDSLSLATLGKKGSLSKLVVSFKIKDGELTGYSFEGKGSSGVKYSIGVEFFSVEKSEIDIL